MSEIVISELVKAGLSAVMAGARVAESARASNVVALKGNLRDIVTQVDLDISKLIVEQFTSKGWAAVSEEMLADTILPAECWVIDPIDGTVNYANGLPQYAISVGWVKEDAFLLGAICAPALDELYLTLNTKRALLNGKPFVHVHQDCDSALVAASFAPNPGLDEYALFQQVNKATRGCLRTGSAALNICWAAVNRLQVAYGFGAKLWDVAGALAVARAAGCEVRVVPCAQSLTLDYCVGSKEVVDHIISMASAHGLWKE